MEGEKNPALEVAKDKIAGEGDGIVMLSTGYRARIVPVGSSVVTEAAGRIREPEVPRVYDEGKGREIENPMHPDYLAAVGDVNVRRAAAVQDTLVLLGVELIDPVPEDGQWLSKLRMAEKLGHIDLTPYDLDDLFEREFVFKKYIAVGTLDLIQIGRYAGINAEALAEAVEKFRG